MGRYKAQPPYAVYEIMGDKERKCCSSPNPENLAWALVSRRRSGEGRVFVGRTFSGSPLPSPARVLVSAEIELLGEELGELI